MLPEWPLPIEAQANHLEREARPQTLTPLLARETRTMTENTLRKAADGFHSEAVVKVAQ